MHKQLLLCKRLYQEGEAFSDRGDPVSSGMAISLFQDAAEMVIWTLIKEKNVSVKDGSSFTSNLDILKNAGITLSLTAKLLELNKARVGFKHYGNLPAPDEATKFRAYVEEFLRLTFADHFGQNFDTLSMIDLVIFDDVRSHLKAASKAITSSKYDDAIRECAIAKAILFGKLDRFIPGVDRNLKSVDKTFEYLANYLGLLREASLTSLLKLTIKDHTFIQAGLPSAVQFGDGRWQTVLSRTYDEAHCNRAMNCLVNLSMRLETILQ